MHLLPGYLSAEDIPAVKAKLCCSLRIDELAAVTACRNRNFFRIDIENIIGTDCRSYFQR